MANNQVSIVAVAGVTTGAMFIYAGLKGKSILATIQSVVQGNSPSGLPTANAITGSYIAQPIGQGIGAGNASTQTGALSSGISGGPSPSGSGAGLSPSQYQAYAFSLFPQYGWGADQKQPLIDLWNRESGWDPTAYFPSTHTTNPDDHHAFGIPQSLPASKMAAAGPDWRTNGFTQIRWGLSYISQVYHNPAGAWANELAVGSY